VSFQSAGAVRSRVAFDPAPKGIEADFAAMLRRINQLPPRKFSPFVPPDGEELQDRADILRCHIRAFRDYVRAYMADCANASWHVETANLFIEGLFEDMQADCCGCLQKAADEAREGSTYRAA
jgi:hypothetical protein